MVYWGAPQSSEDARVTLVAHTSEVYLCQLKAVQLPIPGITPTQELVGRALVAECPLAVQTGDPCAQLWTRLQQEVMLWSLAERRTAGPYPSGCYMTSWSRSGTVKTSQSWMTFCMAFRL